MVNTGHTGRPSLITRIARSVITGRSSSSLHLTTAFPSPSRFAGPLRFSLPFFSLVLNYRSLEARCHSFILPGGHPAIAEYTHTFRSFHPHSLERACALFAIERVRSLQNTAQRASAISTGLIPAEIVSPVTPCRTCIVQDPKR